ncbi:MAG TPA: cohesin domain-containing protein [Bryobacteraceae bacterium]|nr:cohesin domain-containing protein [Bryobacteraceae bacterium]
MHLFNRLTAVVLAAALAAPLAPLQGKTRKGDHYLAQGRIHQEKQEWDEALADYQKALAEDPAEMVYRMAVDKARFEDAQMHIEKGIKIRAQGQLGEALLEFRKAYSINPSSSVAAQELTLTQEMIERERLHVQQTGKELAPADRGLTPAEQERKETQERIDRMMPVPELRPLNPEPIRNLKINGQPVKVLYETIGKVAGINIIWDSEFTTPSKNSFNIDFENSTLEQALDYIAVETHTFWKPISANAIFITNDNTNKRREYAELVAQTFYLTNVSSPQEIQEIVNAVRSIAELQRVVAFTSQNAIIVRGEADQVALAGKMIHDLDKPRPEVVVDIMVMEASSVFTRQLTTAVASTGLNVPVNFTPRSTLQVQTSSTSSSTSNTNNGTTNTSTNTNANASASSTNGLQIPLANLGHLSSQDFSITLPSALLQAALSDTKTKVLQAPELRTVDMAKAELKIGERQPTATGSFQPGIGGVGINPLVNTQFNYIDVGVNVELQAHVHDNGDVSLHIVLDISTVSGYANIGGIQQPIIGQRKVTHDIRMHEGEVNLLGGLVNQSDNKQITGIPGLSSIPLLGKLFSGQSVDRERDEIMIALIPHIVRQPDIEPSNLRGIAVGNQTTIKLNYAPKASDVISGAQAAALLQQQQGNPPAPATAMPPATTTPATTPAAAPPATAPPATAPPATAPPLGVPGAPPQPAGSATVQFSPPQAQTRVGSSLSVSLVLQGGADVASAPMQISFDPKVLRLNDVVRGDLFSSDGQQPIFTKNVMNDNGSATIQLGRQPGSPGVNGSGVLVTLNFQAVGKGATAVSVPNLTVRNSKGQPVASGTPQMTVTVQ